MTPMRSGSLILAVRFRKVSMTAQGRGCVKTRCATVLRNIDLSERAVFDYFRVRKGERTPEHEMDVRFHTASVGSGSDIGMTALRETTVQ
jgi:hypothetical protein